MIKRLRPARRPGIGILVSNNTNMAVVATCVKIFDVLRSVTASEIDRLELLWRTIKNWLMRTCDTLSTVLKHASMTREVVQA